MKRKEEIMMIMISMEIMMMMRMMLTLIKTTRIAEMILNIVGP